MKDKKTKLVGIYCITNKINGKKYIGQSTDIFGRWKQHVLNIKKKTKNTLIRSAMIHYGIKNFIFEILELCPEYKLDEREIYFIKKYNTYYLWECSNGYNMTIGGNGRNGYGVPVKQYDLDGNYIQTFHSVAEASRITNTSAAGITNCCGKRRKQAGGYMWCYESDEIINPYSPKGNKVLQYDLLGNYIRTFDNATQAAKFIGKTKSLVCGACRGVFPSAGGYIWKYAKNVFNVE